MSYREDLDAAIARIYVLERQLRELAAGGSSDALEAANEMNLQLSAELDKLRRDHAEAMDELQKLRERRPARPTTQSQIHELEGIPSLLEHNRRLPPLGGGIPAAVLCPSCLTLGNRCIMFELPGAQAIDASLGTTVICPRCATTGLLRRSVDG